MMARVEGEVERWEKRGGSSCHILGTISALSWQILGDLGGHLLFFESIHLVWPVDLDMGDEGEGIGEVEVPACWGS